MRPKIDFTRMRSVVIRDNKHLRLARYGMLNDSSFWDNLWKDQSKLNVAHPQQIPPSDITRSIIRHIPQGARTIEAGCGNGRVVHKLNLLGLNCTGLDFAPSTIIKLRQIFSDYMFCVGDVRHLSLRDSSYDAYISLGVLEHFEDSSDMRLALQEAARVVKPDGILFLEVPFFNPWRILRARLNLWHKSSEKQAFFEYAYTKEEVCEMVAAAGFSIKHVKNRNSFLTVEQDMFLGNIFFTAYRIRLGGLLRRFVRLFPDALFGHVLQVVGQKKHKNTNTIRS